MEVYIMTWFTYSILALVFWGGSGVLSKCASKHEDKYSQYRIMAILGIVMGLHGIYLLFTSQELAETPYKLINLWYYLPSGFLYILSMAIGYSGLRYIVLGVSSPLSNASGVVLMLLCWLLLGQTASMPAILSALLLTFSVTALAWVEAKNPSDQVEDGKVLKMSKKDAMIGIIFALGYCVLDAAGTMAETAMYDMNLMGEDAGSVSYEIMWLVVGIGSLIYLCFIKKQPLLKWPGKRYLVGQSICETLGNYFYIYAIATDMAILAGPLIGCYAILSVLGGRIFLKEKLSKAHYACIVVAMIGIALLGYYGE